MFYLIYVSKANSIYFCVGVLMYIIVKWDTVGFKKII